MVSFDSFPLFGLLDPIGHHSWEVLWMASSVCTELMVSQTSPAVPNIHMLYHRYRWFGLVSCLMTYEPS